MGQADSIANGRIAGCEVLAVLRPGATWLARTPEGQKVVLKALGADCLLAGQLHPNVRDRLGRIRELAHLGVANLYGVHGDANGMWMVWEYVEGDSLADIRAAGKTSDGQFPPYSQDLIRSVETLHTLGIVHGALHERNIFIDRMGQIRVTHVSPLLYHDPTTDIEALVSILRLAKFVENGPSILITRAGAPAAHQVSLADLRHVLKQAEAPPCRTSAHDIAIAEEQKARRRAWEMVALVIVLTLGLALSIWRWTADSGRTSFVPPEAPAQAMDPRPR